MPAPHDPTHLPADLHVPLDDGGADHLGSAPFDAIPEIALPCTDGRVWSPSDITATPVVFFLYPRTGVPGQPPSLGFNGEDWDSIPGARGCTPQSCGFRDLYQEFRERCVDVYGLSTNTVEHQREFKERNHIPFDFFSDHELKLTRALRLPTFDFPVESGGPTTLLRRMAIYCDCCAILRTFYPVFPPDRCATTVLDWIKRQERIRVAEATPAHANFIRAAVNASWGGSEIWSRGKKFDTAALPTLVATLDDQPAGVLTYHIDPATNELEVITIDAAVQGKGVGSALMDEAEFLARRAGCRRLFLTTSNDNLPALAFYQKRGMRISAIYPNAVDDARRLKPIPALGHHGIPIRDEIELERRLTLREA